ncbi:MAG: (d)CMP kinase [Candidatus Kapaibacterium sp.]|nr:MAG: (d)CMP kinase [Candidatus Kapabacteria bacterium]
MPQSSERRIIIALDGPAGSGKSTTARNIAHTLGYVYIDTGAMYRAITLAALRAGAAIHNDALQAILQSARIELLPSTDGQRTLLNGEDVSAEIRSHEVTEAVSGVSALGVVRSAMVERQRELGSAGGVVMDGRDIGTVVFPQAELKIFLVASLEERARRRLAELGAGASAANITLDEMCAQLGERDRQDSEREISPLTKATDAIEIDTSALSIDQQVAQILAFAHERIQR